MQLPVLALLVVCLTPVTTFTTPTCPPSHFSTQFEHSRDFDLDAFIGAQWYVQQQMECALEPANLFQCQWAKYKKIEETSPWGFTIKAHNHIDQIPGNATTMDLHPCVAIVDAPRGKLSVGQCFLPEALAGPYWVYLYDESKGYAAVGGGPPTEAAPGGCRTGTGHTNSGLWIFTRAQARSESLVQTVRGKLQKMGFDLDALRDVRQTGCPE